MELMIIDCISDLHGHYPKLEGGDLLIVAGDWTASDKSHEVIKFGLWINEQKYKRKILIAGNHDNIIQNIPSIFEELSDFVLTYLCDSGTEFLYWPKTSSTGEMMCGREKLKIWGSPWTLRFPGINPHCMAFTCETEEELAEKWAMIPDDIDILITHCPPYGIFDQTNRFLKRPDGSIMRCFDHTGSKSLHEKVCTLKPKVHCFGHIHEAYGNRELGYTHFANASHVNERYEPVNKPVRIEL